MGTDGQLDGGKVSDETEDPENDDVGLPAMTLERRAGPFHGFEIRWR